MKTESANRYTVRLDEASIGGLPLYVARDPDLPGCMAHGDNIPDALVNLAEARRLYLEDSPAILVGALRTSEAEVLLVGGGATFSSGSIMSTAVMAMPQLIPVGDSEPTRAAS